MDPSGQLMPEIPVSRVLATYHGNQYRILFGGSDWVALKTEQDVTFPDSFAKGQSESWGEVEFWQKVPISTLDCVTDVIVTGKLSGHTVSLLDHLPDGRVQFEFVGPPNVARELGLDGDQYMGWTGIVDFEDLTDVQVKESRRA